MNNLGEEPASPQTFLYGCMLEAGKEVEFNPEGDEFEHQLDLRMISVDPSTKDEHHMVEVEGQDAEGQKVKAILASLRPSTLPCVCLGGFLITPPTVFRLKAGAGPIHISGQHLMIEADQSFDEEEEEDECEDEEEDVTTSKKRPASSPAIKSQKKMKMDMEDDDDEEEDDDEDDEEEEDEDEDDEVEEAKGDTTPVKAKPAPSKQRTPAQNGKSSKPSTPAPKPEKTPKRKGDKAKSPQSPKATLPEVQAKLMDAVKKGVTLPKVQPKFENLLKQSYKVSDAKDIAELWKWRQSLKQAK